VGAYCLGGCDPIFSHSLDSCVPAPICKSQDYKLTSLDGIMPNTKYLGDATKSNWVSSGQPVAFENSVLLTMAQGTVGTLLASTSYMWYGKAAATLKTSRTAGVVTAFILLSDVKDEIDFEFVGTDLGTAQSNYYFQGITNCKCLSFLKDATANLSQITMSKTSLSLTPSEPITPTRLTGHRTPSPGRSMVLHTAPRRGAIHGTPQQTSITSRKPQLAFNFPSGLLG